MPESDGYNDCCHRAALELDAAFCPECGHVLYRCANRECRSLVDPRGHCPVCIQPRLFLEKGAVLVAEKNECMTIPFVLKNGSPLSHALSIQNVFTYGKNVKNEAVQIGWEKLEAGRERSFFVETEPFTGSGTVSLGLRVIVASRVEEIEELYAFAGDMMIDVEGGNVQFNQSVNLDGANIGDNAIINVPMKAQESGYKKRQGEALTVRLEVPFQRIDRFERENGYRGYKTTGSKIPRNVEFVFDGFPATDKPANGPLRGLQPILRCGRNSRTFDAQRNAQPNDLCLRIYDTRTLELDAEASSTISRHVCEFMLQNDRLYLRALTDRGLSQNGEILNSGDIVVVNHGDSFTTPVRPGKAVTFSTKFKISRGEVTQIRFELARDVSRRNN